MSLNDAGWRLQSSVGEHSGVASPKRREHVQLNFASDNITKQSANMEAAYGRIMDADIAAESTCLAKYNVRSKFGRHALSSQLVFRRRADASALKNEEL